MTENNINQISQYAIPSLTISAQVAIALKYPEWGLVINLAAQPFWLFSGWRSWKKAGQIGIFLTTIIFTLVTMGGIINYWLFN